MMKSSIGGKQYLEYLWELGELPVSTLIGGVGACASPGSPWSVHGETQGISHPCGNIQDVVKYDRT